MLCDRGNTYYAETVAIQGLQDAHLQAEQGISKGDEGVEVVNGCLLLLLISPLIIAAHKSSHRVSTHSIQDHLFCGFVKLTKQQNGNTTICMPADTPTNRI